MRLYDLKESKETLALIDLPYGIKDLEPIMDEKTIKFHYSVLSKGYVDRFNNNEGDPVFNKAGALLHNLWWAQLMKPKNNNTPTGPSKEIIDEKYGNFDKFKDNFIEESLKLQGSGWCYLSTSGSIKIIKNHQWKSDIAMLIDEWEHVSPFNVRKDFLKNIWKIINWDIVNDRLINQS